MNLRQAYIATIKAFPGSWDTMSAALAMTRDALENRIYERRGQDLTQQTALQMQIFSNTTYIAEAFAIESGGTFMKLPCVEHVGDEQVAAKFQELVEEIGLLSAKFRAATKDGFIDKKEEATIDGIVDAIHRTTAEFKALSKKYNGMHRHVVSQGTVQHD